jgi:type VI secretion system protein ImpC
MLNRSMAPKNADAANADALISNLVAGYGVPEADPQQAELVALVEDALSAGLRAVLRHPAFQAVEGAWRSVEFLVARRNTDEDLKLCVLDISKEELFADLTGTPDLQDAGIYKILIENTRAPGAVPYSLVVGDYDFDQSEANVALLAKIAALVHEAHIPFLAGATAKLPGFPSFAAPPDAGKWQPPGDIALWEKFRASKYAAHLGLAAPRFLLRLPYGPKTDAIDAYPFSEIPAAAHAPTIDQYLWANGAFAVALLFGQGFLDGGWDNIDPGNDVSDLPCHMALVDGDKEMTPCAQGFLTDRVGDILHQLGLIPLLSVRNAAAVKVAGIHSIAKGQPLAASWGEQ